MSLPDPYYEDEHATIYNGESLRVLERLETGSVSAVIADPPYSSGGLMRSDREQDPLEKYRGWSQGGDGKSIAPKSETGTFSGDSRDQRSYQYWSALWLSQACRVAGPGAQLFQFTDWRQLPTTTDSVQAGGWVWRGVVVWDKKIGRPMKGRFRNHLEYLVWASNGPMPEPDEVYPSALMQHAPPSGDDRIHVTQKPEALITEILKVAPSGKILDPFMGTGATLLAAKNEGREVVGIELDERYCEIAAERLSQGVLALDS